MAHKLPLFERFLHRIALFCRRTSRVFAPAAIVFAGAAIVAYVLGGYAADHLTWFEVLAVMACGSLVYSAIAQLIVECARDFLTNAEGKRRRS